VLFIRKRLEIYRTLRPASLVPTMVPWETWSALSTSIPRPLLNRSQDAWTTSSHTESMSSVLSTLEALSTNMAVGIPPGKGSKSSSISTQLAHQITVAHMMDWTHIHAPSMASSLGMLSFPALLLPSCCAALVYKADCDSQSEKRIKWPHLSKSSDLLESQLPSLPSCQELISPEQFFFSVDEIALWICATTEKYFF